MQAALASEREKVFVALCDEQVVGYIHAENYEVLYYPSMKNLLGFAVLRDYQRKGIGSRFLLEGVEPFVRSTGGHSLGLITNRDYNVPFYEKNGYKQCGYKALTYETHKLGNWPFVKSLDE